MSCIKIQTTSKNAQGYYISKRLIPNLSSTSFLLLAFLTSLNVLKTLKIVKIFVQRALTRGFQYVVLQQVLYVVQQLLYFAACFLYIN